MLPDFPSSRAKLDKFLTTFLEARMRFHEGVVGEVPHHSIHEGHESSIIRPDGDEDQTSFATGQEELLIKLEELPDMTLGQHLAKLDEMAKGLAKQKAKYFFDILSEATERTGNVVDGRGKPLSAEVMLEVIDKVQMDFDSDGNADGMTFAVSPKIYEKMPEIIKEAEENPELQRRHKAIMARKREEWRAREAARKLVG